MNKFYALGACALLAAPAFAESHGMSYSSAVTYGVRPAYVVSQMADGALKDKLMSCMAQTPKTSKFSIGHRGAALMFPEHTAESYRAAAAQGAGIIECDVTFTADKQLVCRHAQNDLHTTTNIVASDLASKCTKPFAPASGDAKASAECRTSDLTLDEFKSLKPKMDAANSAATTAAEYLGGTANWRTDLYAGNAHVMTHAESIALIDSLGADFTPELKAASVEMPYDGMTQADYAQAMIDEYKAAGIDPSRVWAQSFNLDDIKYWIANEPEFGKQAVYLDDRYEAADEDEGMIDYMDATTFKPSMAELKEMGVNYIAPPMWMLVTLDETGKIVPSVYTKEAEAAGLKIITWTLERSGPLASGGGWYFQSITDATKNDGVYYELLDVLAQDVKIEGIFSDWPATVTYYANCMGL
jgi:glycerophosphoryl diester phosphodiesterase